MMTYFMSLMLAVSVGAADPEGAAGKKASYEYDAADQTIHGQLLDNPEFYDADIVTDGDDARLAWLEFVPGKGDRIWFGHRRGEEWLSKTCVTTRPGRYAKPTLTRTSDGQFWLSFETERDGQWDIYLAPCVDYKKIGEPKRISPDAGADINHAVAADKNGGLWIVWQSDQRGQFDILARHIDAAGKESSVSVVSESMPGGDWRPDVVMTSNERLVVAWDGFDGTSYNIYLRARQAEHWAPILPVAASKAFEANVSVAADPAGRVWLAWECGAENWGQSYKAEMNLRPEVGVAMQDHCGPLHGYRLIELSALAADGQIVRERAPLPMPAAAKARTRQHLMPGAALLGTFYEKPRLAVDDGGRLWLTYRHFIAPWLGVSKQSHIEEGVALFSRCLGRDGWSPLVRLNSVQGDGMQRVETAPARDGISVVWTIGRTDRRPEERKRGLVWANVRQDGVGAPTIGSPERSRSSPSADTPSGAVISSTVVKDANLTLFYGDLHRHTDLSLCMVPSDGTIEDAYRFAIDAAHLDFMAVTDHSRDIARGNPNSQLWWRNVKEVLRHELKGRFYPLYAHEHSQAGKDHNVISLRSDMLRPDKLPFPTFWKEMDNDTFTIPHQTITNPIPASGVIPQSITPKTWEQQDDAHRPLIEVYQGCRSRFIEGDVNEALGRGYLMGFIASSDHYSTNASFACVWAEKRDRETIFRALQARRTYGATSKIRLKVMAGEHWMGERFTATELPALHIEAEGTAPIRNVEIVVDGNVKKRYEMDKQDFALVHPAEAVPAGVHYIYARLQQADGNAAWGSPMWIVVPEKAK